MTVTPPGSTPPPPLTDPAQQGARRDAGDGAMGAGGQRGQQHGNTGQKASDGARQSRFDGALSKARGADEAEAGPKGMSLPAAAMSLLQGDGDGPGQHRREGQTPDGPQILQVIAPQTGTTQTSTAQASTSVTPTAQGAQAHAADVQHLSDRIGNEVRMAEAQALRGPPGVQHSLALDMPRNGLGLTGFVLQFGAKELTVTLRVPAGAEAHGFNEATAQLAQSLAQRFPTRVIRIAREDGTEIVPLEDTAEAPIDPFSLLRVTR